VLFQAERLRIAMDLELATVLATDNSSNLSDKFLAAIKRKYEGTRLGRQELEAELLEDIEGALWRRSLIESLRIKQFDLPLLKRIVIAIDLPLNFHPAAPRASANVTPFGAVSVPA
jgi:phage terminase large subunit-like protein